MGCGSIDNLLNTHTLASTKVANFINNGMWNVEKLNSCLYDIITNIVTSIPLNLMYKDTILFTNSCNGDFKLSDTWDKFWVNLPSSDVFGKIWGKSIPLSILVNCWRIIKGFIPIDSQLIKKGFYFPSKCLCCSQIETINHVFISSPIASKVWIWLDDICNFHH